MCYCDFFSIPISIHEINEDYFEDKKETNKFNEEYAVIARHRFFGKVLLGLIIFDFQKQWVTLLLR